MNEYHRNYFGKREIRNHVPKKMVFPNVCPSCGKPLTRISKNKVGNLCRKCGPGFKRRPENEASPCRYCPYEQTCMTRVQLGIWVICETPDYGDLERLKRNEDIFDDELVENIELSLEHKGNRKSLERSIDHNALEIYQNILDGKFSQTEIRFDETIMEDKRRLR